MALVVRARFLSWKVFGEPAPGTWRPKKYFARRNISTKLHSARSDALPKINQKLRGPPYEARDIKAPTKVGV
jgi:hypothetical protein